MSKNRGRKKRTTRTKMSPRVNDMLRSIEPSHPVVADTLRLYINELHRRLAEKRHAADPD